MCEKQGKDEQRYAEKYANYVKLLKDTLSKKRFTHSVNVAAMCLALAKKHGGDEEKAYLAGLLHDIKKEETPNAMKSQAILSNMDHTAGRADMSLLEKIVYLGDLTSADRSYKDVEKYREMSFENLDNAMYNALKYSIGETLGKGGVIPPCTIAGYNFYTKLMRARKSETERKNPKND